MVRGNSDIKKKKKLTRAKVSLCNFIPSCNLDSYPAIGHANKTEYLITNFQGP